MCTNIDKTHTILSEPVFAYAIYIPPNFQREVISLRRGGSSYLLPFLPSTTDTMPDE